MRVARLCMLLVVVAGCSKGSSGDNVEPKPDEEEPPAAPAPAPVVKAGLEPNGSLEARERVVTLKVGDRSFEGTIAAPVRQATDWRAAAGVVLLAGSGPTDRDWNNPLLPGKRGSGRLLAMQLARHGVVSIRFDKTGTGNNKGPAPDKLGLDTFSDEGRAALAALRAAPELHPEASLFIAGHSEGGIHATRIAQAEKGKVAGVIYLSAPGRSMKDLVLEQLEGNFRDGARMKPAEVKQQMEPIRAAFDDFLAGKPVDPAKASAIPQVQQLLAAFFNPAAARLSREMLAFDPAIEAAKLEVPVLVLNGDRDIQVDPERDARRLQRAIHDAGRKVDLDIVSDADHVLKHEPKTMEQLRADLVAVQTNYNAEDRDLDVGVMVRIMDWLKNRNP